MMMTMTAMTSSTNRGGKRNNSGRRGKRETYEKLLKVYLKNEDANTDKGQDKNDSRKS